MLNQARSEIVDPALEALAWAREVATQSPDLLRHPPAYPKSKQLKAVPVAALREYLDALLMGRYVQHGLDALLEVGALRVWLPEVEAMVGFGDGEWQHKDLWKHSKQVVWQSVPRLQVRWGALLHDIGKVKTRRVSQDSQIRFFGHSEVGAAMFRKQIARRLGFEGELFERIHYLILYHLRASQYDSSWTDSAVRRFTRAMGEGLNDLLDLGRADITTKRLGRRKRGLSQIDELETRIRQLRIEDAKQPALPKGLGDRIMEFFDLPPSRAIGNLKRRLEEQVERGELEARRPIEYYMRWLQEHRDELEI